MRWNLIVAATAIALGCKDKPAPEPAPSASASVPAAQAASALPQLDASVADAAVAATPKLCPPLVPGANTEIADVEGGVKLTVTGADATAIANIREQAKKLADAVRADADAGVRHSGHGEGAGNERAGRCPVVLRDANVKFEEVASGTQIVAIAKKKADVEWLRRETRDRLAEAKSPLGERSDRKQLRHCPSSVEGAATKLKETKTGVVLTVTGTGATVAEIRARAKHTAGISKLPADAGAIAHNGEGGGRGDDGRCPVVVAGDTSVVVTDVDGGADIAVTAKKDVPGLQRETRQRLRALGLR